MPYVSSSSKCALTTPTVLTISKNIKYKLVMLEQMPHNSSPYVSFLSKCVLNTYCPIGVQKIYIRMTEPNII